MDVSTRAPARPGPINRRNFSRSLAALGALSLAVPARSQATGFFARRPIGLQLFSVLGLLEQDFEATLQAVAKIGYREVETIGGFGRPPLWVADQLKACGLTSPSQHLVPHDTYKTFADLTAKRITVDQLITVYLDTFDPDKIVSIIEEAIARAKPLGQKYIVWPIMFDQQLSNQSLLSRYIKAFNQAGELCASEDMIFAYHNHAREFKKIGSDIPFDLIIENTDPHRVKFELDYFWMRQGGVDPLIYLRKYPDRFRLMHLKDRGPLGEIVDVGLGDFDFRSVLLAADQAGVEHYFVERDDPSADPLSNARTSLNNLIQMT